MGLKQTISNNLGWKILSIVLATMIWFTVSNSIRSPESGRPFGSLSMRTRMLTGVPITVMTAAADGGGFKVDPPSVNITLRVEEDLDQTLKSSDVVAYVSLVDVRDAVRLRKRIHVTVPSGAVVVRLEPADVFVDRVEVTGP